METPALPGRVAMGRRPGRRKLAPSRSHLGRARVRARARARARVRARVRVRVRAGARRMAPAGTVALPSAAPRPDQGQG